MLLILALAGAVAVGGAVDAQAITKHAAKHQTNVYAKTQCQRDSKCKRYGAADCHAFRQGVSCFAFNFELSTANGKYTCHRFIKWYDFTHYHAAQWQCKVPGWTFQF
jgi:hypothetical protein